MNVCSTWYGDKLISKIGDQRSRSICKDQFVKVTINDLDRTKDQDQLHDLDLGDQKIMIFLQLSLFCLFVQFLVDKTTELFSRTHSTIIELLIL